MRSAPNLSGSVIGVLSGGTQLTVLEKPVFAIPKVGVVNQWLHILAPTGREGYVAAWYVELDQTPAEFPPPSTLIVFVTPIAYNGLRMRSGPSTSSPVVKTLKPHSALIVLESEEVAIAKVGATGEWLHVRDETDTEGYVAAWFVIR